MKITVYIALALYFVLLPFNKLSAQKKSSVGSCELELVRQSWSSGLAVLTSPAMADYKDWLGLGAVAGATGIVMLHDLEIHQSLSQPGGAFVDGLGQYVAEPFGNIYWVGGLSLGSYLVACYSGQEQWAQTSSQVWRSVMISAGITVFLKGMTHRERPLYQEEADPYNFYGPSFSTDNLSFPSAHTAVAFALATSLSKNLNRWYYSVPLYGLASLTAWQRIYNHQHWPSDVILGGIIGVFVGWKVYRHEFPKDIYSLGLAPGPWGGANISLTIALDRH